MRKPQLPCLRSWISETLQISDSSHRTADINFVKNKFIGEIGWERRRLSDLSVSETHFLSVPTLLGQVKTYIGTGAIRKTHLPGDKRNPGICRLDAQVGGYAPNLRSITPITPIYLSEAFSSDLIKLLDSGYQARRS